ncbi:formimidoylglutamate deiminase [Leekyejoonella antrihumi]|uniref:Formimidoylglutamate deiminase n=1 Tax=Leekyejoonella antrihumi TaxID=1660198 RepID=A0A563DVB3_9MICO|nr:formimidoylglutamate deiminase [Leekyejoonella antrihumi]TWP34198.1 formimidoylglutamate deiminase [Leekyejoonella antrihumi]
MTTYWAQHATLRGGVAPGVTLEVMDGRFTRIDTHTNPGAAQRLSGIALPGLANCHSHAFHRALRGRTHHEGGTFWTWRKGMYAVASRLDPDRYLALARATYAEMALAGITAVGEFHYLHHQVDGTAYADANVMGEALRQAAAEAGVRLTLLDTCYVSGGLDEAGHLEIADEQRRFSDGDADGWARRWHDLKPDANTAIGAAIHSVRAVPRDQMRTVVTAAEGGPLHLHLSEQPAENQACRQHYGCTPTQLLRDVGALGAHTTAVHATHLTDDDIALLGGTRTTCCFCPTTERDLADGIGPARALLDAGSPLSLGSDQHAVIDLIEEARALEMHERLSTLTRGRLDHDALLTAATDHRSIGWSDAGALEVGARADLVTVRSDSPRTAGAAPEQILYAASGADVDTVIRDGEVVVQDGRHRLGDVGALLARAIAPLWEDAT